MGEGKRPTDQELEDKKQAELQAEREEHDRRTNRTSTKDLDRYASTEVTKD